MLRILRKLRECEGGATAIEYGLIGGLLSVVIIGVMIRVSGGITDVYTQIITAIQNALST
jgi:pilus assembly protein Flp/PilA